jgi:hypothetical protein
MKDRLNLFIAAVAIATIMIAVISHAAEITLEWDLPQSPAEGQYWTEGYLFYAHEDGAEYDYDNYINWGWKGQFCDDVSCKFTLPGDFTEKLYITAKAFNSQESDDKANWVLSEPSNEVVFNPLDTNETDDDGDGMSEHQGDCNDGDDTIYLGAPEICGDGIDQDCDGSDLACANTVPMVSIQLKATEGSYIYDGTKWYRITTNGFIEEDPNE